MDTRLTSPLHDPLPILIIVNQARQLLQCPHLTLRVALPGAPASGHLLVLGGAALHLRLHQGSNTLPGQKTVAKMSYTAHDTGCIRRTCGNKDES
jgi:hypothetical protein